MKPKQPFLPIDFWAIFLIISGFGVWLIPGAASAAPDWYNASWTRRSPIEITGSTAGAQTDYPVSVSVTYDANMQTDFGDLRFTSADGTTLLSHWLETKTDSSSATVWVKIPSLPASPDTVTIYMYYGNAAVADGSDGDSVFLLFDEFGGVNFTDNTKWTRLADMPEALEQHASDVLNGVLYIAGGINSSQAHSKKVYAYDIAANTWSTKADLPQASQSAIMKAVNGKLYYIGGYDSTTLTKYAKTYEYDPALNTWATKTDAPTAREDMGAAVIADKIYVFGGITNPTDNSIVDTVDVYDPALDSWTTQSGTMPEPRTLGNPVDSYNGLAYIAGGSSDNSTYPNFTNNLRLDVYDPDTNTFTQKANMKFGAAYKDLVALNGKLYSIMGALTYNRMISQIIEIYDITNNTWSLEFAPYYTGFAGARPYGDSIYITGGLTTEGTPRVQSAATWRYTPGSGSPSATTTPDVAKWTAAKKGSDSAEVNVDPNTKSLRLGGAPNTISSGNVQSVDTFTNGISIEMRHAISHARYPHTALGTTPIQDYAGASTDWFSTSMGTGYYWWWYDPVFGSNVVSDLSIVETTAGALWSTLVGENYPTLTTPKADIGFWDRLTYIYDSSGNLSMSVNGTQLINTTDTTSLNTAKYLLLSQGEYTDGSGGYRDIDWVFVRPYVSAAPSVGAAGTEEIQASVSIGAPSVASTDAGPVTYTITYTNAATVTLAAADVTLNQTGTATGTVAVSGSGTETRTVTISGISGNGTLGISLAADTATLDCAAAGPSDTFTVVNTAVAAAVEDTGTISGAYIFAAATPPLESMAMAKNQALLQTLITILNQLRTLAAQVSLSFTQPLYFNLDHSEVKLLQQILNRDPDTRVAEAGPGAPGEETTYFGKLTLKAVQVFQLKYQITSPSDSAYGFVGPKTRAKLNELLFN